MENIGLINNLKDESGRDFLLAEIDDNKNIAEIEILKDFDIEQFEFIFEDAGIDVSDIEPEFMLNITFGKFPNATGANYIVTKSGELWVSQKNYADGFCGQCFIEDGELIPAEY